MLRNEKILHNLAESGQRVQRFSVVDNSDCSPGV